MRQVRQVLAMGLAKSGKARTRVPLRKSKLLETYELWEKGGQTRPEDGQRGQQVGAGSSLKEEQACRVQDGRWGSRKDSGIDRDGQHQRS